MPCFTARGWASWTTTAHVAVLIQKVVGTRYRHYLFPRLLASGTAAIHSAGTPRSAVMMASSGLSRVRHARCRARCKRLPTYRRTQSPGVASARGLRQLVRKYAQRYIDLLDLEDGQLKTLLRRRSSRPTIRGYATWHRWTKAITLPSSSARLPRNENAGCC